MSQTTINPDGQPVGQPGQLADSRDVEADSGFSSEASAGIAFGEPVKLDTGDVTGKSVKKLSSRTDRVQGVSIFGFNHAKGTGGDLNDAGEQKPKASLDILRRGAFYVYVAEAVTAGDGAFVQAVATGTIPVGAWKKSGDPGQSGLAGASFCIDISKNAQYLTSAGLSGLAKVMADFVVKP